MNRLSGILVIHGEEDVKQRGVNLDQAAELAEGTFKSYGFNLLLLLLKFRGFSPHIGDGTRLKRGPKSFDFGLFLDESCDSLVDDREAFSQNFWVPG